MKVAVIITCHNERPWIANAIYTARVQTVKPDRIIVIDDGSTDGSEREYRPWDVEHRRISQRGMAAARNVGLMVAGDCDWVVHLDGDDRLDLKFIEETLAVSKGNDAVVPNIHEDDGVEYQPPRVNLESMLERCELPSTALFLREALVGIGGFRSDLGGDCDWGAWVELLARGATLTYARDAWYHHTKREGSLTSTETAADRERHHAIIRGLV